MKLRQSALAPFRCSADVLGGRYRLDAVIGSGGAGEVHRGFDLRLKRPVAVKVFHVGSGGHREDGFHSEAVILARLQHPGLVTVYDAGRHDGRAFLVMELIEGPTLKARIAASPLGPGETAALGADLARALAHAHDAGIVHRDVKPSNIILDGSGRPHLTDFGISRLLDATTQTTTDALIGTAAYLSPEQVLGRPVGPAADVYALGLVLLECVTSRLEYDGAPLESAIARLHRRPELPDSLPAELASLLGDMTALEAQDRPSTDDCARALAALAGTTGFNRPVAPPADVASLVPRQAPTRAEVTHSYASSTAGIAGTAAPKTVPPRGRHLVAGTAAALAAAVAATMAVSDGSAHPTETRVMKSPSVADGTPRTSVPGHEERSAPAEPSGREAPAGRPQDAGSAVTSAAVPVRAVTERETAATTRVPSTPDTSGTEARGQRGAGAAHRRSGKSSKPEKLHQKQTEKAGKHAGKAEKQAGKAEKKAGKAEKKN
ncbi:serine/threonine protein kinase [Streptomyces capoamus]|uniref:non-specific serine/threonine protein kinase n=1 Tax=Streptomyces capoamus TaxID=68183 RepID=A0A919C340_9ACTN|nr:serine/threonine-protein kinase [Streptomyces capoamus]GGW13976.1 serine/threonine protein kinase [Streptomyces libani subsp. rufus]GHG40351.1 serine/threonine protein kinase [Streptomyces capoamus]